MPQTTTPFNFAAVLRKLVIGARFAAPAAVYGLATALAMWIVFFVSHQPGTDTPPILIGIALLACMAIGAGLAGQQFGRTLGWRVGVASGWMTVKLNLLLVGAYIVRAPAAVTAGQTEPAQGFSGLSLSSLGPLAGFTMASVGISLLAGL